MRFEYWSISRDKQAERLVNPYALLNDNGVWYLVGHDVDREAIRTFRVSRIRGDIRLATRRERDFRLPAEFEVEEYRQRPPWQIGEIVGEARIAVAPDTAWWVERAFGDRGRVDGGVFVTDYSSLPLLASWVLRQDGRAVPLEPEALVDEVQESLERVRSRHEGEPPKIARQRRAEPGELIDRPAGPVAPERFGVLQALLAYLLDRCGEEKTAEIPASELVERFRIPEESLEEHLSLLNLVNFGGGCYAVYAQLSGDTVHVEKELFGDAFRSSPRLTPLEARAIRLALEFVGPMIAADANTPLERVRRKLEETFGAFELSQTPEPSVRPAEETLVTTLTQGIRERRLVELEYLKEGEEHPSKRVVEPYAIERRLPFWYVHTWDRTSDGERSFRLDRMRNAKLQKRTFEPREGFEPSRTARRPACADLVLAGRSPAGRSSAARTPLTDGAAVSETPVGLARVAGRRDPVRPRRGGRAGARGPAQPDGGAGGFAGERAARRRARLAVLEGDRRVPLQQAAVVARDEQPVVAAAELVRVGLQPLDERDDRLGAVRQRLAGAALLDAAVPRADVLADVAAVDLGAEVLAVRLRDRLAPTASSTTGTSSRRACPARPARRSGTPRCRACSCRSRGSAAASARAPRR